MGGLIPLGSTTFSLFSGGVAIGPSPGAWSSHAREQANLGGDRSCGFDGRPNAPTHRKVMDRQFLTDFPITPEAQHFHIIRRQDRRRPTRAGIRRRLASRRFSSMTATTDNNAIAGSKRAVVVNCMSSNLTARLLRLVIFLHDPTPLVPTASSCLNGKKRSVKTTHVFVVKPKAWRPVLRHG